MVKFSKKKKKEQEDYMAKVLELFSEIVKRH